MLLKARHIDPIIKTAFISVCSIFSVTSLYAQKSDYENSAFKVPFNFITDSNKTTFYYCIQGVCKLYNLDSVSYINPTMQVKAAPKVIASLPKVYHVPFMELHGNITYSFDYRSRLDTPYMVKNLQQHNEQTYFDAIFKNRFPFRIILNSRQSNSPFFKNYTDVNIQFNHQVFLQKIKESMIADLNKKLQKIEDLTKYEEVINKKKEEYSILKNWVDNPARAQDIVREKENLYEKYLQLNQLQYQLPVSFNEYFNILNRKNKSLSPELNDLSENLPSNEAKRKDSLFSLLHQPTETEKNIQRNKKQLDSLSKVITVFEHQVDSLKQNTSSEISASINKIKSAVSINELNEIGKNTGIKNIGKEDRKLLSVTQLGIGRNAINYSDLTVNNVCITGLNVEYNPSFYAAFAGGSVDYLFRDFVVKPNFIPKQNLVLGRVGWGNRDNRIFIVTVYTGAKNSFGSTLPDTTLPTATIRKTTIFGYSFEGKYKLNQNADASFEVAKSSVPAISNPGSEKSFVRAFDFSDHNNEAWSAKINFYLPNTRSTVNLFYKQVGSNFQSYSIYNTGNRQEAWEIRWRQYFLQRRLSLSFQIRKNSFDDPLLPINYNSSTIFKSVQAVYRRRKWPIISIGYMPSAQIIKNPNGYLSQRMYYMLTTNIFYNYTLARLHMNSNVMYNKFYNQGTDSVFVFYNAKSFLYSHNMDIGKWHSQSDVQYMKQPSLSYWSFQQRMDYKIADYLIAGAGLKNNLIPLRSSTYWGGTAQLNLRVKRLGSLRLQYDKGYLPNGSSGLVSNNWGRATWFRTF